jgi:flavin-dependent dehydrogenase
VAAGAELREGFAVDELLGADGVVGGIRGRTQTGKMTTERAAVVVGADGRHSRVAKLVQASDYNRRPSRMAMYYAYWSGLHVEGFQTTIRAERKRGWAAAPTNDALTMLGFGWPIEEFHQNRGDIEGNFWAAVELDPEFAEQLRGARRESRFAGTAELGGYFREPYGPGWALVGDAGYHKNPITAMGINDAFRDAALLARALDESLSGGRAYEEAMRDYQRARDRDAAPVYEFTDEFARLEPPPPQMQQLLAAIRDNQDAIDAFIGVQAATVPAPEFFAPQNIDSLMAQAATA